jgi:membrane associated rhomboid family serine protease
MGRRSSRVAPLEAIGTPATASASIQNAAAQPDGRVEAWTVADGIADSMGARSRASVSGPGFIVHGVASVGPRQQDARRVVTLSSPGVALDESSNTDSGGVVRASTDTRTREFAALLPGAVVPPSASASAAALSSRSRSHDAAAAAGGAPLFGSSSQFWGSQSQSHGGRESEFVLLEDLRFSAGLLWPPFAPTRLLYTLYLRPNDSSALSVFPVAPAASCTVNGRAGPPGARSIDVTAAVQRLTVHVSSVDSPPTPYIITLVLVPADAYDAFQAGRVPQCVPLNPPPPTAPPSLAEFGAGQPCRVVMEFDGAPHGATSLSSSGPGLVVSSALRDDARGWWAARATQGAGAMEPFWAPAMCLRMLDHEPPPEPPPTRGVPTAPTPEAGPEQLWDAMSKLRQAVNPHDRAAGEERLVRSLAALDKRELSFAEAALKPELGVSIRHQAVHFPYFSCLLAAALIFALVGTLARFGGARPVENPLLGAPWDGLRRSGACWPPDLHAGHVYQPFTALIIPAGAVALVYDLVLLKLVVARQERVYGPLRIAGTFFGCGAGGHVAAAVFTPRWVNTGPEPGIAAVMTVLALELTLRGRWTRGRLLDTGLLVGAMAVLAIIAGFPGVSLWAWLGGTVLGVPVAFLYSRRLLYDERSVWYARVVGASLSAAMAVMLIVGFWVGVDPSDPWCGACAKVCYDVHGWCDVTDTS